ncbi:formin-1-like isoform X2 [Anolis carolinensis]|uniref:formin-1-like isoform X2 n=1 Tax=Anolis carolinensis TaxID=28377 RepID=UPI002F2B5A7D
MSSPGGSRARGRPPLPREAGGEESATPFPLSSLPEGGAGPCPGRPPFQAWASRGPPFPPCLPACLHPGVWAWPPSGPPSSERTPLLPPSGECSQACERKKERFRPITRTLPWAEKAVVQRRREAPGREWRTLCRRSSSPERRRRRTSRCRKVTSERVLRRTRRESFARGVL